MRTPKAVFTQTGTGQRVFEVAISERNGWLVGNLSIHALNQPPLERSFEGESCQEVASALALLTALAIDPDAKIAETTELLAPGVPPKQSWPTPAPWMLAPVPPVQRGRPPAGTHTWQPGAGVLLGMAGGIAPVSIPSAELYGELRRTRSGLDATGFRVGVVSMSNDLLGGSGAPAQWTWIAVRAQTCALRVAIARSVDAESCGGLSLGTIRSEGTQIAVPERRWEAWAEAMAVEAARYHPTPWLHLEARAGISVPLTRYEFVYQQPLQTIYHTSRVAWLGQAGVGLRW